MDLKCSNNLKWVNQFTDKLQILIFHDRISFKIIIILKFLIDYSH